MRVEDLPVDHFVGVPNLVNCLHRHVGGLFQIAMESSNKKNIPILGTMLKFMDNVTCKIVTHSISKKLKEAKKTSAKFLHPSINFR